MNLLAWFVLVTNGSLPAQVPDRVLQMARMKRGMMESLRNMPNYACAVTLQRAELRPRGVQYTAVEQTSYEIAYADGREYLSRDGRPFEPNVEERSVGRVFSHGEFASHAKSVFGDGFTTMRFAAEDSFNGRPALRWSFEIPQFGSGWTIHHEEGSTTVGSAGSFWVTADTLQLLRLELNAVDLPHQYASATTNVDYGPVMLGSRKVLLPQTATVVLVRGTGENLMNIMEFSHCRQFTASSTLTFDADAQVKAAAAPLPLTLPSGLSVRFTLDQAIDVAQSSAGDSLRMTVASDVVVNGKTILRKGDVATGRMRRLEAVALPSFQHAISVEMTELRSGGRQGPFFLTLRRIETTMPHSISRPVWSADDPLLRLRKPSLFFNPAFRGVTTILLPSPGVLPAGLTMVWGS